MVSTDTRSQSNKAPLGCGRPGPGCAAETSAVTVWRVLLWIVYVWMVEYVLKNTLSAKLEYKNAEILIYLPINQASINY